MGRPTGEWNWLAKASNILGDAYETVAAEPSNGSVQGSAAGEGAVNSLSLAERAYLDKLQERIQTIQQQIAALAAQATSYAMQLPTNTIPYAYGNVSRATPGKRQGTEIRLLYGSKPTSN